MHSYRFRGVDVSLIPGTTREEHQFLHKCLTNHQVTLSPDGSRIMRTKAGAPYPAARASRNWTHSPNIAISGAKAPAYVIAHILRVGPDGPLIGPGPWVPIDGDWLNVHPDNWPPTALF